ASVLLVLSGIVLVGHLLTFALVLVDQPPGALFLARAGTVVLGGLALWWFRRGGVLPTTAAERQLWTIWAGYLLAYAAASLATRWLVRGGALAAGPGAPPHWEEVVSYPFAAVLSGL